MHVTTVRARVRSANCARISSPLPRRGTRNSHRFNGLAALAPQTEDHVGDRSMSNAGGKFATYDEHRRFDEHGGIITGRGLHRRETARHSERAGAPSVDRWISPLLAIAAMSAIGCGADRKPDAQLVITDVTLLTAPGEPSVKGATLVFEHERVSAILTHGDVPPPAKTTLGGRGLFATAGFWNSHV